MLNRAFLTLTCLLVCAAARPIQQTRHTPQRTVRNPVPTGTTVLRDLRYRTGDHPRHTLDLYVPAVEEGSKLPLIVWVHGGGWRNGSKDRCRAVRFLERGYAVASVNYRLSHHALYPAQIIDCKAAIRWLRKHAGKHNIDPGRVGVWGSSAGGHLVALLGTTGDIEEFEQGEYLDVPSRVQAVCDYFGPTDFALMDAQAAGKGRFLHDAPTSPESRLIGAPIQQALDKVAKANPVSFVTADDPPFLIMHGAADPLVPYQQSQILHQALLSNKCDTTLRIVPAAGHGLRGEEIDNQVNQFFDRVLKPAQRSGNG